MNDIKFCSVLKDHPDVLAQSRKYPYINVKYDSTKIPETFDGRYVWSMYIEPPFIQRSSNDWAIVAKDVLNDRYCLSTAGQLYFFLDSTIMLSCMNKVPYKKLVNVPSTNSLSDNIGEYDSTQGYSIFDAWEYIYSYGLPMWNCLSREHMIKEGMNPPNKVKYKDRGQYKEYCLRLNECQRKEDGKPIARRCFPCDGIFNIEGKDMNQRIINIKYQIAKWGPVVGGFLVYENFVNSYKGVDIYSKGEGKVLGGHYVSIVGWGKYNNVEYWICRNSFGANWGLMGYFYMKMGISECKLEYNITTVSPSLPNNPRYEKNLLTPDGMMYNGKSVYVDNMKDINNVIYEIRQSQKFDRNLFYRKDTIDMIKSGKLYSFPFGKLTPVIMYPELLPDMYFFWLKDLTKYDYINVEGRLFYENKDIEKTSIISRYIIIVLIVGIVFFIVGFLNNNYKKYNK
jgi:hypothetical protein